MITVSWCMLKVALAKHSAISAEITWNNIIISMISRFVSCIFRQPRFKAMQLTSHRAITVRARPVVPGSRSHKESHYVALDSQFDSHWSRIVPRRHESVHVRSSHVGLHIQKCQDIQRCFLRSLLHLQSRGESPNIVKLLKQLRHLQKTSLSKRNEIIGHLRIS